MATWKKQRALIESHFCVAKKVELRSCQYDADYFYRVLDAENSRTLDQDNLDAISDTILRAYRWQYIVSGVEHLKFQKVLTGMISTEQMQRIIKALEPIMSA